MTPIELVHEIGTPPVQILTSIAFLDTQSIVQYINH